MDENEPSFVVNLKEKSIAKPVSTYVEQTKKALTHHIVGGCFSEKKNAKKMVEELKGKGFDAFIIGKRKGLWTVSYSSFSTQKEAALNYLKAPKLLQRTNEDIGKSYDEFVVDLFETESKKQQEVIPQKSKFRKNNPFRSIIFSKLCLSKKDVY